MPSFAFWFDAYSDFQYSSIDDETMNDSSNTQIYRVVFFFKIRVFPDVSEKGWHQLSHLPYFNLLTTNYETHVKIEKYSTSIPKYQMITTSTKFIYPPRSTKTCIKYCDNLPLTHRVGYFYPHLNLLSINGMFVRFLNYISFLKDTSTVCFCYFK